MQSQEVVICNYKNNTVRIHFPDRKKEDFDKAMKEATEKFLRKVEVQRKRKKSEKERQ